jgi:hypothetical protein
VTQANLSKRIAVSVGLINALLKRAIYKGHVKAHAAPYKRYAYYLTPGGFSEKSRLVAEYLEGSLSFFRKARQEYLEMLSFARSSGIRQVAFAGCGELAEIALLAAREAEVQVVGIIDAKSEVKTCCGLTVVQRLEALQPVHALLITDAREPQRAFDKLLEQITEHQILAPPFLRIMRLPIRQNATIDDQ